jgi:hypothetical protein
MDELRKNIEYLTGIMHYMDKGDVWEVLRDGTHEYHGLGIGVQKRIREPAYKALEWIIQNKEYNFKELDDWYIKSNEEFLEKCIILYGYMTKFKLG